MDSKLEAMFEDVDSDDSQAIESTEAVETSEEASDEEKSFLLESTEETESEPVRERKQTLVPVAALQKERQKRHELQRQLDELQSQPEPDLDFSELDEDPDGLIDAKTAKRHIENAVKVAVASTLKESDRRKQAESEQAAKQQRKALVAKSEADARGKFKDYDDVVGRAIEDGIFTNDEIRAISSSKNPGVVMYRKSKEALSMLGVVDVNVTKQNDQSPDDTDENIYEAVFGKPG